MSGELRDVNVVIDTKSMVKTLSRTNKQLVRDCAMALFTSSSIDENNTSVFQVAKKCVDRAVVFVSELKKQKIID